MRESGMRRVRASTSPKERLFSKNRFGTVVRALWPDKPALNLAQRIGCSERGAQYIIDGKRRGKLFARALHVVEGEMLD
jgi:hypothetical protein